MRDMGAATGGVVTLHQFKDFFRRNRFDETTLETSYRRLTSEMQRWSPLRVDGIDKGIPLLWEQAVADAVVFLRQTYPSLYIRNPPLDAFLLVEAPVIRFEMFLRQLDFKVWRTISDGVSIYQSAHHCLLPLPCPCDSIDFTGNLQAISRRPKPIYISVQRSSCSR